MFEFIIDSINDSGLLVGRNGDHDIRVGTIFTTVRRTRVHRDAERVWSEDAGVVGAIKLTICEVHWYQRIIDVVPGGHTAGLGVTGDGMELLAKLLGCLPQDEYLALEGQEA